ncbi:pyridoxamine 5'-phosphate oxidase family protein [Pseudonocardia acaciae]|uniref:pyridoxamine 5'-phosphate oxidase family protein n=1 Tax=Pseudonocardia acaciae TaxID=551276 RepID=UPI0004911E57|nr:pyridoxamine 5'-phosphate oxidase family protein [Pseudonocardia acaciae]
MFETEAELAETQALLDASLAGASGHLQSIIRAGERTLTARQLVNECQGMCTLALATVTARGEPRISGGDGHLLHGRWVIGTSRSAAKARHLAARPAISAAYMIGEELGVFTHGRAVTLNPPDGPEDPAWPEVSGYLRTFYGDDAGFDWGEVVFYRIDPHWMVAWSSDPSKVAG